MAKNQTIARANSQRILEVIKSLQESRKKWEDGAYKSSNDELYLILERCHKLLVQLRSEQRLRKAFIKGLEGIGISFRANTSLELKVIHSVFEKENQRIYAYVRVLQIAKNDLPKDQTMPDWIEEQGGIEEIRRRPKDGQSAADKARMNRERAEEEMSKGPSIGEAFKPVESLQPNPDSKYEFSVALVRITSSGNAEIVFGSNKETLVKAVLTEAGRKISEEEENTNIELEQTNRRKVRDSVLDSIAGLDELIEDAA